MKIDHKELQRLYQADIMRKIPATRKLCPDLEQIIACFEAKGPKGKGQIVEHIVNCGYCWQEFDFVLQTARAEKGLLRQIAPIIQTSGSHRGSRRWWPFFRLSVAQASLIFVGLLCFLALFVLFRTNVLKRATTEERGKPTGPILLLQPTEKAGTSAPLIFRWREFSHADSYVLELYDESLILMWRSPHLTETKLLLPGNVVSRLIKRKDYFWMVTSFRNQEKLHESSLARFYLSD